MSEEKVPLVAVLAAGVFALQAFNIPVMMGTSGHLVGGALVAIVLGSPFAAVFVLSLVLIVQGVLFGDGGITTMGANIVNMGVIGGFVGYYGYHGLLPLTRNMYASAAGAAWLACVIPALAAALELAVAGTFPLVPGLIGMGVYHALIGTDRGRDHGRRPRTDRERTAGHPGACQGGAGMISNRALIAAGVVLALVVGVGAVFFASIRPRRAGQHGPVTQGQKELTQPANPTRRSTRRSSPARSSTPPRSPSTHGRRVEALRTSG